MRIFLVVLTLIFSFQSLTKADDIRDFEIEGMSIGDSLLSFFNKNEIEKSFPLPNKKFASHAGLGDNFETYQGFQVFYYTHDDNYIIHYLAGKILYEGSNIDECYNKMYDIVESIKVILPNSPMQDNGVVKHTADKSGKSTAHQIFFSFKDGSELVVTCADWDEGMQKEGTHGDNLAVNVRSAEFAEWLNSGEAYKPN